jgi:maltooligosyltrehalose trehalohydrolase
MHRDLLRIRSDDPAFRDMEQDSIDGAVLGPETFILRYFVSRGRDRLLVVNTGKDTILNPAPEPLLAPPESCSWRLVWSSENPKYGGAGIADLETGRDWKIPGWSATFLCSEVSCNGS